MYKYGVLLALCVAAASASPRLAPHQARKLVPNLDECTVCTFVVSFVEKLVDMGEPMIESELKSLCAALGPVESVCDMVVSELPAVLKYLEQSFTPKKICTELSLCGAKKAPVQAATVIKPPTNPKLFGVTECSVCTWAINRVEDLVGLGESALELKLKTECLVFGPLAYVCDKVVDELPAVTHYLEQEFPAEWICKELSLCSADQVKTKVVVQSQKAAVTTLPNDGCSICTYVVQFVETLVDQGEEQIEEKLEELCAMMGPVRPACDTLVMMLPTILKYLEQSYTPKQICTKLSLCQTAPVALPAVKIQPAAAALPNLDGCSVCTFVVQYVETLVNQGEPLIEEKLKELCGSLGPLASICDSMIEYLPTILKYLEQSYPPKEICTEIGLCSGK